MTGSENPGRETMEVLDALGEGITVHDAEGRIIAANRAARKILHLEQSELLSRSYASPAWTITTLDGRRLDPEELPAARAVEHREPVRNARIVVERPDAAPVVLSVNAVPLGGDAPGGWQAITTFRDVTEQQRAERRFQRLFRESPVGIALVAHDGRPVETNRALAEMLGYAPDDLEEMKFPEFTHPEDVEKDVELFEQVVAGAIDDYQIRKRFLTPDGDVIWADLRVSAVRRAGDEPPYVVGFVRDVTERKKFQEALERQALHDQLTGLPNRTLLRDRLKHALDRAERTGKRVAVLFLDLDRFKAVNDSLGHRVGDRVLRTVARRLTQSLREQDTIARVGGDEFAVLLEDLDRVSDIERAVTRIRQVFETSFEVERTSFELTASIGVAHDGLGFGTPDELVRLADAAMYRVKQPGSTDYHIFEPGRDQEVTDRLQREAALKEAIRDDQFVVYYQPVYRLATREIVGAEALVRWRHPERGLVSPGEFIPLAEETGLIVPMGRRVLEKALRQHARWLENGHISEGEIRVSVNLSARQHEEGDLVEKVVAAAGDAGVPLSALVLEITESVAMTGPETFEALREEGLGIAIDDFGTGYSSLEYLRHFTTDVLKLDRSFVANLGGPDQTSALVQGILDVADRMGIDVVAEGIETEEQLGLLRGFDCSYGQGFLFARPVPADDFARLLAE